MKTYDYWREYPERDTEYVRWYPPTLSEVTGGTIWPQINRSETSRLKAFYLHVPFCATICKYCPFNKYKLTESKLERYLHSIIEEITLVASQEYVKQAQLSAGYFGGGTPTCLPTNLLRKIVEACQSSFSYEENIELTVEANPDTVDEEKLSMLLECGVNRISFGVQSFEDKFLDILGRKHRANQSHTAISLAKKVGFNNIGVDLIFRIPGQNFDNWKHELEVAVDLGVDHISAYSLFIDPGTRLYYETVAKKIKYPQEKEELAMYRELIEFLTKKGYRQYTINDFALPNKDSLHHRINWEAPQGEYVGLGPGAFSHVGDFVYCNAHPLSKYEQLVGQGRLPIVLGTTVDERNRMARYMVLGFKLLSVSKKEFRQTFGKSIHSIFDKEIAELKGNGLLAEEGDKLSLTQSGKIYISNVSKRFYTPENRLKPQPIGVELQSGNGLSLSGINK